MRLHLNVSQGTWVSEWKGNPKIPWPSHTPCSGAFSTWEWIHSCRSCTSWLSCQGSRWEPLIPGGCFLPASLDLPERAQAQHWCTQWGEMRLISDYGIMLMVLESLLWEIVMVLNVICYFISDHYNASLTTEVHLMTFKLYQPTCINSCFILIYFNFIFQFTRLQRELLKLIRFFEENNFKFMK